METLSNGTTPPITADPLASFLRAYLYGTQGSLLYGMRMTAEILREMQKIAEQSLAAAARNPPAYPALFPIFPYFGGPWTQVGQPSAAEPFRGDLEDQPLKEVRRMSVDQDLSGDQVKVVQYTITSAVTDENNDAPTAIGPETVAFADDMSGEDFVAWMMAINAAALQALDPPPNPKYLRVAYQVIGRFAQADFNYKKKTVHELEDIASAIRESDQPPQTKKG